MNAYPNPARLKLRAGLSIALILTAAALVLAFLLAFLAAPIPARADGGGWPTSTWTPLPTWPASITPQPTTGGLIFPATPTWTPAAGIVQEQNPGISDNGIPAQLATEEPSGFRFSTLMCVPLGIVVLLLLVVGFILLRNRVVARE